MTSSVALIDPLAEIDGRKVFFLRDTFGGEVPLSCPYPPLELAFAASLLREGGHRCELVAANVQGLSHAVVAQKLQDTTPSFVLIPSAWGSLDDDRRLMQELRVRLPDSVLCISGPNVTANAARVLSESDADVVIRGEPEEAIRLLADGVQWHDIPNLAFMNGSDVQLTERRLPPGWMTQPMPARDLLDLNLS